MDNVLGDALVYTEYNKRRTVALMDIVHACKRNGRIMYGAFQKDNAKTKKIAFA